MNVDLNQILAVGLTVSQLFTQSVDQFRTAFNPQADQEQVAQLLHSGCEILKKELGADQGDLTQPEFDQVINQMLNQLDSARNLAQKKESETPSSEGEPDETDLMMPSGERNGRSFMDRLGKLDIDGLKRAYKQFCIQEKIDQPIQLEATINYFNSVMKDLPNPAVLKDLHLPQTSFIQDRNGQRFTEVFVNGQRRRWLPLSEIPEHLKLAIIDTEDRRFYKHIGIDLRGILRAYGENFKSEGRPQGASTITQQVVKNMLLNNKKDWNRPNFERKIPEMYLAVLLEKYLSKDQILELYLNYIDLGRASAGVEMAALSYFGKSARNVDVAEAAFLAGMAKGPNFYNPDKNPDRALKRRQTVLFNMKEEEGKKAASSDSSARPLSETDYKKYALKNLNFVEFESPRTRYAYYFVNEVIQEAKEANHPLTSGSFTVRTTVDPELQRFSDVTLREELIKYESDSGTQKFERAVGNIEKEMKESNVAWDEILNKTNPLTYWDLHWPLAVVLEVPGTSVRKNGRRQTSSGWSVGLADGTIVNLSGVKGGAASVLKRFDLIHVELTGKLAKLVIPPRVEGALVVIENATGRILSMSGGFSFGKPPSNYAATSPGKFPVKSEFNRVTQGALQPGSTIKPFTYLAALHLNFQPNTLIANTPIELNPIEKGGDYFAPHNYDGTAEGLVTMRQGLERSLNIPATRMMSKLRSPAEGLDYIINLTRQLGIYTDIDRKYPFVLGSQPARLIDMVKAYATIANDGLQPKPHVIEEITTDDKLVYRPKRFSLKPILFNDETPTEDRVAFYQLRRMLMTTMQDADNGIPINGTAKALKDLYGYIGCKTGTTNNFRHAWFIGFTDKITVGTWISYDDNKIRSTLGKGFTGGRIALPIAEKVIRKSFELYGKRPLPGPPDQIRSQIVEYPIDRQTGQFNPNSDFREVFRVAGNSNSPINTWQSALDRDHLHLSMSGTYNENDSNDYVQQAYEDPRYEIPQYEGQPNGWGNPYQQYQQQPSDSFYSGFPFFQ